MDLDWTTIIVALVSSTLVLDIWKTIKEAAAKRKKQDFASDIKNINNEITKISGTVERNYEEMKAGFKTYDEKFTEIDSNLKSLHKNIDEIKETINQNSEGTILGLENDVVIFNALRNNHINGESELQEKKMSAYYAKCAEKSFKL